MCSSKPHIQFNTKDIAHACLKVKISPTGIAVGFYKTGASICSRLALHKKSGICIPDFKYKPLNCQKNDISVSVIFLFWGRLWGENPLNPKEIKAFWLSIKRLRVPEGAPNQYNPNYIVTSEWFGFTFYLSDLK